MTAPRRYLLTTLALLGVGLAWAAGEAWLWRPAPPAPPAAAARPGLPSAPVTAAAVLARREELALDAGQVSSLETLAQEWQPRAQALEAAAGAAAAGFRKFLDTGGGGRRPLPEIQQQSAEYLERSRALREERERHARAALAVLNEAQRGRLAGEAGVRAKGETR